MNTTRPDRFDIPGVSPEREDWIEQAFQSVFSNIPKPVTPEKENSHV